MSEEVPEEMQAAVEEAMRNAEELAAGDFVASQFLLEITLAQQLLKVIQAHAAVVGWETLVQALDVATDDNLGWVVKGGGLNLTDNPYMRAMMILGPPPS